MYAPSKAELATPDRSSRIAKNGERATSCSPPPVRRLRSRPRSNAKTQIIETSPVASLVGQRLRRAAVCRLPRAIVPTRPVNLKSGRVETRCTGRVVHADFVTTDFPASRSRSPRPGVGEVPYYRSPRGGADLTFHRNRSNRDSCAGRPDRTANFHPRVPLASKASGSKFDGQNVDARTFATAANCCTRKQYLHDLPVLLAGPMTTR